MIMLFKFLLSFNLLASEFNINITSIKAKDTLKPPKPSFERVSSQIMSYTTDEVFPFESDAKKSCQEKAEILKGYSISVLGCNIVERENDYSFIIEYLPEIKNPQLVSSIVIDDYLPLKTYWNESLARKEMENAFGRFKNSLLKPIDKRIIEKEGGYSFRITYLVQNIIRRLERYYARIDKVRIGSYTFETEAKKSIPTLINLLKQNGVAAISGKVVEEGEYYRVEIDYLNKTDERLTRYNNPQYSIERYISEERFPFEDNAVYEGIKRNESFLKAGMPVILNYAIEKEADWSFGIDYAVKNIYKNGIFVKKEYSIQRYTNPQIFDFESSAKKALDEKIRNFTEAGLYPVGYKIIETSNGYTFIIDYLQKN